MKPLIVALFVPEALNIIWYYNIVESIVTIFQSGFVSVLMGVFQCQGHVMMGVSLC